MGVVKPIKKVLVQKPLCSPELARNHRVAIRPVFAGTVQFLGLGSGVPPSLPLCPGIFDLKFAFINTVCQRYTNEPFVTAYCINLQGTNS